MQATGNLKEDGYMVVVLCQAARKTQVVGAAAISPLTGRPQPEPELCTTETGSLCSSFPQNIWLLTPRSEDSQSPRVTCGRWERVPPSSVCYAHSRPDGDISAHAFDPWSVQHP